MYFYHNATMVTPKATNQNHKNKFNLMLYIMSRNNYFYISLLIRNLWDIYAKLLVYEEMKGVGPGTDMTPLGGT